MKKFFYLLMALPLAFIAASCSDDDDLPDVSINVDYKNVTVVDNQVYVVSGDTMVVDSVYVVSNRADKNAAIVEGVRYWVNGLPVLFNYQSITGQIVNDNLNVVPPYRLSIKTDDSMIGSNTITMNMGIAQEGAELGAAVARIVFKVVASADDIPAGSGPSTGQKIDYKFN